MDPYVKLAREAVEGYVKTGKIIKVPEDLLREFYSRKAGVFVTIRKKGELRGCIGTYRPSQNTIAEEIIDNAVSACSRDYRFPLVSEEELPELSYEVSILSTPKLVKDIKVLNHKEKGIIVKCDDGRSGVLLPNIDGVNTINEQIFIASQKGGINPAFEKIKIYYFTVEKYT